MDMSTKIGEGVIMDYFVSMLLIGIGVALLATGLFTSYFGAGKSQKIGFGLLLLGIATIAYFVVGYPLTEEIMIEAVVSGVAVFSGVAVVSGVGSAVSGTVMYGQSLRTGIARLSVSPP